MEQVMSEKRDTPEQELFRRHCREWLETNTPALPDFKTQGGLSLHSNYDTN
jgi:hypothetical protein